MPDKLTDSEIKKALECCSKANDCCNCEYEPTEHQIGTVGCSNELMKDALDLINRLQAENERLKKSNEMFTDIGKMYSEIKAEAYKEFAELLHCQCESIINQPHNENVRPISWKVAYEEFDDKVDNLLKELVGDNETVL